MSEFQLRVDEGLYLVMSIDGDVDAAAMELRVRPGPSIDAHPDVLFVRTISDEPQVIDLDVELLERAPIERYRDLQRDWPHIYQSQFTVEDRISVSTLEQESAVTLENPPGQYQVILCARIDASNIEQHRLLIWRER